MHVVRLQILLWAAALAHPSLAPDVSPDTWHPAGPGDLRGPCPMMNTLANHGFLPHDGKNLTQEVVMKGLSDGLNFNKELTKIMFDQALIANPEPNATWFDLGQLNRHNVLEHDASLSRSDAFFGNNHIFNQTVFDETRSYWDGPMINASMLGNSKIARQLTSKVTNPTYKFTNVTENFSIGEILAPIVAFGDVDQAIVRKDLVEYFFENERLPTHLGWSKKKNETSLQDILGLMQVLGKASSLITEAADNPPNADIHSPLRK